MEAIVERLELMADPEAMKGLRRARFAHPEAVGASGRAASEGVPDNSLRCESDQLDLSSVCSSVSLDPAKPRFFPQSDPAERQPEPCSQELPESRLAR